MSGRSIPSKRACRSILGSSSILPPLPRARPSELQRPIASSVSTSSNRRWLSTSIPRTQDKATPAAAVVEESVKEEGIAGKGGSKKTLADIIADSIKAAGPISVATFMRTCLLDPSQGYYASANATGDDPVGTGRDVLGARGDFITSPEISQVFGELIAIYFIARWQAVGHSEDTAIRMVELGPGKGTLLADMIRTMAKFPIIKKVKTIHLVETSEGLMKLQIRALEDALRVAGKKIALPDAETLAEDEVRVEYFPLVDAVPVIQDQWTMLVAHEFFDALPIHIFERSAGNTFKELLVEVKRDLPNRNDTSAPQEERVQSGVTTIKVSDLRRNRSSSSSSDNKSSTPAPPAFQYVTSPGETPWSRLLASSNPRFQPLQPGQRVEISPESWASARKVGELIAGRKASTTSNASDSLGQSKEQALRLEEERLKGDSRGGSGLIIDYGDEKAFGNSFRAFKNHAIVDPLMRPGTADLTANVDFNYLKSAIHTTDARSLGIMFQSHFLTALGLTPRVEALVKGASSESNRSKDIESAAKRLIDPTGMGAQYKVLGVDALPSRGTDSEMVAEGEAQGETRVYPFDYEEELRGSTKQ